MEHLIITDAVTTGYFMTTKHNIEIPDLPDGWRAVAYRSPYAGDYYLRSGEIVQALRDIDDGYLIVEKIQPRRIVFEETEEYRIPYIGEHYRRGLVDSKIEYCSNKIDFAVKIWREVNNETDD